MKLLSLFCAGLFALSCMVRIAGAAELKVGDPCAGF